VGVLGESKGEKRGASLVLRLLQDDRGPAESVEEVAGWWAANE